MPTVLIAEDDAETRRGISLALARNHLEVLETNAGQSALELIAEKRPDVVILDVRLNGMNGFEICRRVRKSGCDVPIVFLTARAEEDDRVRGLKMADDYITKPFSIRELQARIAIQLRRRMQGDPGAFVRFGDVEVDFKKLQARRAGKPLKLTAREFAILQYFAEHETQVVSRGELLQYVWKLHPETATRTVDVHIMKLRRKIEPDPESPIFLHSSWGGGYKFVR